jgi:hypothetical protein
LAYLYTSSNEGYGGARIATCWESRKYDNKAD